MDFSQKLSFMFERRETNVVVIKTKNWSRQMNKKKSLRLIFLVEVCVALSFGCHLNLDTRTHITHYSFDVHLNGWIQNGKINLSSLCMHVPAHNFNPSGKIEILCWKIIIWPSENWNGIKLRVSSLLINEPRNEWMLKLLWLLLWLWKWSNSVTFAGKQLSIRHMKWCKIEMRQIKLFFSL